MNTRPPRRGCGGAVAAGHYLGAAIGARVLAEGGNAFDAACATGFALQVLEPHMNGPMGEVPILAWVEAEQRVVAISGQGTAPAAASIEHFTSRGLDRIPGDGVSTATVPAAFDAWCILLERYGTWRIRAVLAPALQLAERGFPMYPRLYGLVRHLEQRFTETWPSTGAVYFPAVPVGGLQTNVVWGRVLARLCEADRGERVAGIRDVRAAFYEGFVAEAIQAFLDTDPPDADGRPTKALLTAQDLARYAGAVEEPVSLSYRGNRVFKCGPWTQGPVFLQQLSLLEGYDLAEMGWGSADALHTWLECNKLAFADREANYADPRFADVDLETLLSADYARRRRALIDPDHASLELRPGLGRLPAGWPFIADATAPTIEPEALSTALGRADTTHLDIADADGNLVSATPSGAWISSSPVIPELGVPLGTRAQMFTLDPDHPCRIEPGKRPRTTLTPSMARLADGRMLAFGTPGGDCQDQWTHHFFLNLVDFGMDSLQAAIDAPTLHSRHMPLSFYPRTAEPGVVWAETRLPEAALRTLIDRGHRVSLTGPWTNGRVLAVARDPDSAVMEAGASPRGEIADAIVLP